jgi:hypothetical protein
MKNLKMSIVLLFTAAVFTSCEKETITLPENAVIKNQETKEIVGQKPMSLFEMAQSGVNMDAYFKSLQKTQSKMASQIAAKRVFNANVTFFESAEEFNNNTLPIEDFEDALGYTQSGFADINEESYPNNPEVWDQDYYYDYFYAYNSFPKILNENNLHEVFNEGDFSSGISFELIKNEADFENSWWRESYNYNDEQLEEMMDNNGFSIQSWDYEYVYHPEWNNSVSKTLFSNYDYTDLVIKFSATNVNSVSLNLIYGGLITFKVYDTSGNLIATDYTYLNYYGNDYLAYWGVTSVVAIGKIVISNEYNYENIDNVTFGNNPDLDGDGVLNENDPFQYSNFSETISIGGNDLNIDNVFAKPGATMMDQIDALVAEINAQYNGDNYAYLHKRFMTKLSAITYYWIKDRLITSSQRSKISSAAWGAEIPYFNQPN